MRRRHSGVVRVTLHVQSHDEDAWDSVDIDEARHAQTTLAWGYSWYAGI